MSGEYEEQVKGEKMEDMEEKMLPTLSDDWHSMLSNFVSIIR